MVLSCQGSDLLLPFEGNKRNIFETIENFSSIVWCLPALPQRCLLPNSVFRERNYQSAELPAGSYQPHRAGSAPGVWVPLELREIDNRTLVIILHLAMHICLLQLTINHGKGRAWLCVSRKALVASGMISNIQFKSSLHSAFSAWFNFTNNKCYIFAPLIWMLTLV